MSEETMASYNKELEASFRKIEEGDIIEGTVIGVTESEVILDLKYYTEGIIRLADYTEDPDFSIKQDVAIGDTVSAEVISLDDGNGNILLSRKQANDVLAWDKLKEYMENGTDLTVQIKGVVNKGVIAYVEGIRGFIPASKLSLSYVENLEDWLLKEIQVRVITADAEAHRLVLSAREILKEKEAEEDVYKRQVLASPTCVTFMSDALAWPAGVPSLPDVLSWPCGCFRSSSSMASGSSSGGIGVSSAAARITAPISFICSSVSFSSSIPTSSCSTCSSDNFFSYVSFNAFSLFCTFSLLILSFSSICTILLPILPEAPASAAWNG